MNNIGFLEGESEPPANDNNNSYSVKFIVVGDTMVGKSNIIYRFIHNEFKPNQFATVGVEYAVKNIIYNNTNYSVKVFDTAGQENFKSLTRGYFKGSAVALVVYDITQESSFENVERWVSDCRDSAPSTVLIALIGNKSDLEKERKISKEKAKEFAKENDMIFFETSALNGNGIENAFNKCVEIIDENIRNGKYNLDDEDNMNKCGIKIISKNVANDGVIDKKALIEGQKKKSRKKCCK